MKTPEPEMEWSEPSCAMHKMFTMDFLSVASSSAFDVVAEAGAVLVACTTGGGGVATVFVATDGVALGGTLVARGFG